MSIVVSNIQYVFFNLFIEILIRINTDLHNYKIDKSKHLKELYFIANYNYKVIVLALQFAEEKWK